MLAKEIVESRKAIKRLHMAKVNLASVDMEIKMQASQLKVAGNLQKSAEVMKAMQQLIKMPEIRKVMKEMSKEMIKVRRSPFKLRMVNIFFCSEVYKLVFAKKILLKR